MILKKPGLNIKKRKPCLTGANEHKPLVYRQGLFCFKELVLNLVQSFGLGGIVVPDVWATAQTVADFTMG
jgi:hypothetical protein